MKFVFVAITICFGFANINAQTAEDYLLTGNNNFNKGKYEQAISDYSNVIKLDNKGDKAYLYRGISKYLMKDDKGAMADFNTVIKLNPDIGEAYYQRGLVYYSMNARANACEDWRKAKELNIAQALSLLETYCE